MGGPVTEFMQRRAVKIGGGEEAAARRQADEIFAQMIESLTACFADGRAAATDKSLGFGVLVGFGIDAGRRRDMGRKSLALLHIEDGEALQERHGRRIVTAFLGALAFAFGHKAVGKTDGRAAFAFADMPAKAQGLAKGQPFLIGKTAPDHGVPQDQDIDAGIKFAARGAARHAQRGRAAGPWAHPWDHALFHFRDDAGCYFVIQGNAALAASLVIGVWAHGYPPARKNPHPSPGKRGGRRNATGRPAIEAGCTLKGPRARVTRGDGAVAKRRTGEAGCDPPGRAYKGAPPTPIFRGSAQTKPAADRPPSFQFAVAIVTRMGRDRHGRARRGL